MLVRGAIEYLRICFPIRWSIKVLDVCPWFNDIDNCLVVYLLLFWQGEVNENNPFDIFDTSNNFAYLFNCEGLLNIGTWSILHLLSLLLVFITLRKLSENVWEFLNIFSRFADFDKIIFFFYLVFIILTMIIKIIIYFLLNYVTIYF